MPSIDLTGKVAVVTGSGRGLGLAYAHALAAHGARVVVNDVDEAVAEQAVKSITGAGGTAVAEVVPVGTTEAAERLVGRAVEEFGRLDVLVTNAGILRDKVLWKMTDDDFDAVITTHLKGTFTCARAAAVRMREQGEGGTLILVGSRPGSAATSVRRTTPPPRPASPPSPAPGPWNWAARTSPSTRSCPSRPPR